MKASDPAADTDPGNGDAPSTSTKTHGAGGGGGGDGGGPPGGRMRNNKRRRPNNRRRRRGDDCEDCGGGGTTRTAQPPPPPPQATDGVEIQTSHRRRRGRGPRGHGDLGGDTSRTAADDAARVVGITKGTKNDDGCCDGVGRRRRNGGGTARSRRRRRDEEVDGRTTAAATSSSSSASAAASSSSLARCDAGDYQDDDEEGGACGESRGVVVQCRKRSASAVLRTSSSSSVEMMRSYPPSSSGRPQPPHAIATLPWPDVPPTPVEVERALLPVLLRWKRSERGMMRDQPPFRLPLIERACRVGGGINLDNGGRGDGRRSTKDGRKCRGEGRRRRPATSTPAQEPVPLPTALSLRRHHVKYQNNHRSYESLGLGRSSDVRTSAALFEDAVASYLRGHGVSFWTEEEQRRRHEEVHVTVGLQKSDIPPLDATPDFLLREPARLQLVKREGGRRQRRRKERRVGGRKSNGAVDRGGRDGGKRDELEEESMSTAASAADEVEVRWVEAKMFYGASTIPAGSKTAVGAVLGTARRYADRFGPGAIVFAYGCGDGLAEELAARGVAALDGGSGFGALDLGIVEEHQRTWCADGRGRILP